MKNKVEYYFVPADKIGLVLIFMDAYDWRFDQGAYTESTSIMSYYIQATSRDYDGHKCVFKLEEWKRFKLVSITSDLIMASNKQKDKVLTYEEFKKRIGL